MANRLFATLKESVAKFVADDAMSLSASIAYYAAFALAPLLLIAVSFAGIFFGEEAVTGALDAELQRTMGPASAKFLQELVAASNSKSDNLLMSLVGLALLLIGASALFGQLQAALNKVWRVESPRAVGWKGFIRGRYLSFSMVLVTGFLLLTSMLLTTFTQMLADRVGHLSGLPVAGWIAGSGILSLAVTILLFAAIFKILPDAHTRWSDVWLGAAFTAVLFMFGKLGIGWYLGRAAAASTYGSAGSFVVLLMWLYYSSIILLFGAVFTEVNSRARFGNNVKLPQDPQKPPTRSNTAPG